MATKNQSFSLQDIAKKTGFGRSTISLALRNHPSIPQSTRATIRKVAEEIGYRPNPLVTALMRQVRNKKRKKRECIAIISRFYHPILKTNSAFHLILYKAIMDELDKNGFDLDEFHHDKEAPLPEKRLSQILISRGIRGVFFFPGNSEEISEYPTLKWDHFSTVLIGFNTSHIELNQVVSDYSYDMDLALQYIARANMKRIGLTITPFLDSCTNYAWTSRYLLYQSSLPTRARLPIYRSINHHSIDKQSFLSWVKHCRPDTILISSPQLREWLIESGYHVPRDIRLVNLVQRNEEGLAGVDPCTKEMGLAAADLLISLLQTNQFGLPRFARTVSIKGQWAPGTSFP